MTTPDQDAAMCEHAARFCDAQLGFSTGRHLRALAVKLRGMGDLPPFLRSLAGNLRGKAEILRKQNDGYMQHSCLDLARIIDEYLAAHPAQAAGKKEHGDE